MTAEILVVLLIAALTFTALAGPRVLRHAAPALVRTPRAAVVLLAGSVLVWVLTALALGPLLAWAISGPALLPEPAADVCQRCLDAANPFQGSPADTAVPAIMLLVLPALAAVSLGTVVAVEARQRHRLTTRTARSLRDHAQPRALLGYQVLVTRDPRPLALSLPRRHGGIIVSTATLDTLATDELTAVLAHEHAHLSQRHHLITTTIASIARYLRWVPLIAAAETALRHYLETAADNAARREAGTPALASALLILGEHAHPGGAGVTVDGALHMTGPDRIRHLVQPHTGVSGMLPALAATTYVAALALLATTVHLPYLIAALTGCA